MTFDLWHKDTPTFRNNTVSDIRRDFPTGFSMVATIEAPEAHAVFGLSQHIDRPWTQNPEVTALPLGPRQRSTSVGDIFLETGTLHGWTVDGMGLTEFNLAGRLTSTF